jgi:hypothetical protein
MNINQPCPVLLNSTTGNDGGAWASRLYLIGGQYIGYPNLTNGVFQTDASRTAGGMTIYTTDGGITVSSQGDGGIKLLSSGNGGMFIASKTGGIRFKKYVENPNAIPFNAPAQPKYIDAPLTATTMPGADTASIDASTGDIWTSGNITTAKTLYADTVNAQHFPTLRLTKQNWNSGANCTGPIFFTDSCTINNSWASHSHSIGSFTNQTQPGGIQSHIHFITTASYNTNPTSDFHTHSISCGGGAQYYVCVGPM